MWEVDSVVDRWLGNKASCSYSSWKAVLNRFKVYVGCDTFEDLLDLEDPYKRVVEWMDSLKLAPQSVNTYVSRVKGFYGHFGVDLGYMPKVRSRVIYPHKALTLEEIRLMIRHADVRDKALVWLLYCSGARIRSVLSLNVGRINLGGDPPVKLHFYPRETKFNIEYDTFICKDCLEALNNYLRWRRRRGHKVIGKSPLFVTKYGSKLSYAASLKSMRLVIEKAGLKVSENERLAHHSFRAAFHRNLQIVGVNQYIIERLMGHSTESTTTGRYSIGLTTEDMRYAYSKANWSLEVDEAKVKELESKVEETEKILGAEVVNRHKLIEELREENRLLKEQWREFDEFKVEVERYLKLRKNL